MTCGRAPASAPCSLATVDVQDLSGDERGTLEVQDPVDDIVDLPQPAQRVKLSQAPV